METRERHIKRKQGLVTRQKRTASKIELLLKDGW